MNTFRLFAPVVSQPAACQETPGADDAAKVKPTDDAAAAVTASAAPPLSLPPPWALPPVDIAGLADPLDERSPFHSYFLQSVLPQWCMAEPDCGAGEGWGAPETAAAKARALEAPAVGALLAEVLGDGVADLREGGEFDLTCIDAADVDDDEGDGAPQQKKRGRRTRCQVAATRLASELVASAASASGSGRASKRRRVQRRARVVVPEAAAPTATAANGVGGGAHEHDSDDDVVSEDLLSQTQPSGLVDADDGAADAASDAGASDAGDAATLAAAARDVVALLCDDTASGGDNDGSRGAADVMRRRYCAPPPAGADAALTRLSPRDAAAAARLHRGHLRPLHTRLRQATEADAAADDAAEKKNGATSDGDGDDPMGADEENDADAADVPSAALCAAVEAFAGFANFFLETAAAFAADPSAAASAEEVSGRRAVLAVYCELGGIVALLLLLLARRRRRQQRRTLLRPSPPSAARGCALVSAFVGRLAGDDFFLSRVTLVPLLRVTEAAEAAWRAEQQQASAFALLASSAANRACVRSFLSSVAALAEERGAAGEEALPAELRGAVAGAALRGVFVLPAALGRHNPVLGPCLRTVCGAVRASVANDSEAAAAAAEEEQGATAGDGVLESLGGDVARGLSQGLSLEASAVDVAATIHSGTPVRSAVVKAAAAAAEAGGSGEGGVATSPLAELLTGVCEACCGGGSAAGLRAAGRIAREVLAAVLACCAGEGAPKERAARKAALAAVWNVTDALCARADRGSVAATYVLAVLVKCLVGAAAPPPPPSAEDADEEGGGAKQRKKKKKATKQKTAGSLAGCTDADLQMILRCLSRVAATLSAHHAQLVDSVLPCAEAAVLAGDAFFALYLSRDNPHAAERQKDVLRACLRAGGGGDGDGNDDDDKERRHRQLAGSLSDEGWRRVSFLATRFFRFSAFKCCSVPALLDRLVQVLLRQGGGAGVACRRQAVRQVSALLRLPAPPAEAHAAAVARIGGAGTAVAPPPSIDLRMYTLSLFMRAVGQPSPLIREAALDLVPLVRGSAASADNPLCVEALLGLLGAERSATVVRKTVDLLAEEVVAKATPSAPVRLRVLRQIFRALAPLLREEQEAAAAAAAAAATAAAASQAAAGGRGGSGGTQEHRLKVAVVKLAERLWMASLCGDEGASAECGAQEAAALWGGAGVAAGGGDEDAAPLAGRHACVREIGSLCAAGGAAVEDAMVRVLAGCVVAAAGGRASAGGGRSTGDVVQALYDAASSNLERPAMQEPCSLFLRVIARVDGLVHTGEALAQQQQQQRQPRFQRAAAGVATRRTATLLLVGKHLARRLEEGVQQRRMEPAALACAERLLDAMRHVFSAQRSAGLLLPAAAAADGGESPAFVAGHVLPLLGAFIGAAPSQAVLAAAVRAVCAVPYVVRAPPPGCLAFVHPAAAQMATNLLESAVRLLEKVSKALAGDGSGNADEGSDDDDDDDDAESSAESVNSAEEEASEVLAVFGRRMRRWRQRAKKRGDGSDDDDDEEEADSDSDSSADSSDLDDLPDAVALLCKRLFVAGEVLKNFAYTGLLCDALPPGHASDSRLAVLDRCVAAASAALAGLDVSEAAGNGGAAAAAAPFPAERRRLVPLLCLVAVSACGHDPFRHFRTLRPVFEGLVARCTDEARSGDATSALGPACLQIAKGLTHHVRQEAERVSASAQHATVYLTRDRADPTRVVAATSAATVDASGGGVGVSCIACELSHVYLAPVAELSLVAAAAGQPALRSACVGFVHACAEQSLASPVALAPALVAHASLAGEECGASSVAAASLHLLGTLAKGSFRGEVVSRMGVGIAAAFYLQPSPEEASGFASGAAAAAAGGGGGGAPSRTSLFSPLHALLAATPSAAEKIAEVFAHLLRRTVLAGRGLDEGSSSSDPFDVGSLAGLPSPPQAAPSAGIRLGELRRVLHLFRFLLEAAATLPFHKTREVLRLITAVDLHVDAAAELLLASVAAAAPPARGRPRKGAPPQRPWAALLAACGLAFGLVFARRAAERYGLTTRQVRRYADGDGGGEGAAAAVRRQRASGGEEAEDGGRDEDVADAMSAELRELVAKIEAAVLKDAPPPPAAEEEDESSSSSSSSSSSGSSSNSGGDGDGREPDGRVIGTRQLGAGVAAWRFVSGYLDEALSERSKRSLAYGGGGRQRSKNQRKKRGRRRRASSSSTESASSSTEESSAMSSDASSDESSSDSEVRVAALRRVPRVALTPTKGAKKRQQQQQRRRVAGGGGDVAARLDLEELASSGRSSDSSS